MICHMHCEFRNQFANLQSYLQAEVFYVICAVFPIAQLTILPNYTLYFANNAANSASANPSCKATAEDAAICLLIKFV